MPLPTGGANGQCLLSRLLAFFEGKALVHVQDGLTKPSHVVAFLREFKHVKPLMIGGNRESKSPGIGDRVERFLAVVFRRLAEEGLVAAGDG
jgi:hypothetical protein